MAAPIHSSGGEDSDRTGAAPHDPAASNDPAAPHDPTAQKDSAEPHDPAAPNETRSVRPAAVVAALATLGGIAALALGTDTVLAGVLAAAAGVGFATVWWAAGEGTPGSRAIGTGVVVLASLALAGAVALAARTGQTAALRAAAAGLALFVAIAAAGGTATFSGAVGDRSVWAAITLVTVAASAHSVVAGVALAVTVPDGSFGTVSTVLRALPAALWTVASTMVSPSTSVAGAVASLGLALLLTVSCLTVVPRLPIARFVASERRDRVEARVAAVVDAARRSTKLIVLLASLVFLGWFAWLVASLSDNPQAARIVDGPVGAVVEGSATLLLDGLAAVWPLRAAFLVGAGVLWTSLTIAWLLPWVARRRRGAVVGWLPSLLVCTGIALAGALASGVAHGRLVDVARSGPDAVQVPGAGAVPTVELVGLLEPPTGHVVVPAVVTLVLFWTVLVFLGIESLAAFRLLPTRGAPGALAAASLVAATIAAGGLGASTAVLAVAVLCAVLAWDAAVYGASIAVELGPDAATHGPLVTHTVGSLAVGGVGVAIAVGASKGLLGAVSPAYAAAAVVPVVCALLASLVLLKRRTTAATAAGSGVDAPSVGAATASAAATPGDVPTSGDAATAVDAAPSAPAAAGSREPTDAGESRSASDPTGAAESTQAVEPPESERADDGVEEPTPTEDHATPEETVESDEPSTRQLMWLALFLVAMGLLGFAWRAGLPGDVTVVAMLGLLVASALVTNVLDLVQ